MIVSFDIPNAVAQELNNIALSNGFVNAKAMMIAYLKATIKSNRDNTIRKATPEANTSDVVIS